MQKNITTVPANMIQESQDYNNLENPLLPDQRYHHLQPVMNHNELIKDDGFVNHMKEFGVLDWGRLENQKSNEKRAPPRFNNNATLVDSRLLRFSRNKKQTHQTPNGSPLDSWSKERLPPRVTWPRGKPVAVKPQITETENCPCPNDHMIEALSGVSHSCPLPFGDRSVEDNIKISKKLDLKDRKPSSPNRRFNFSFGKMGRSYSAKESTDQASVDSDSDSWKKPNASNRSRASPLRRFLDPLLKPKVPHLAERDHKLEQDSSPTIARVNVNELLQAKKHRSSNVQALVQLTLKNGFPFFKLVVESSSELLAAAVKKLPSGKDDASLIYLFYSAHETKKKSGGWMHQSSKEKGHCFEYDIVGQMKITTSYHSEFSGFEKGLYVMRESVLYSTETMQADQNQNTLDCVLEGELAAIMVKNPSNETCGGIGSSRTTIVVLPDHVHTWPSSGFPSPLINRWRSVGGCDCGGWDIGCQFRVLSSCQNETLMSSTSPATSNHLELCYQVGLKNKCGFRLVSVGDGLYSLEYDPSMSLLQAFSICVAVVSSHKLTHIFDVNHVPDLKDLSKAIPTDNEKGRGQAPASPGAWV